MSDMKFTPGPWDLGDECNSGAEVCIGETVATVGRDHWMTGNYVIERDEMRANARLIAAAPELYEMLDRIWHECSDDLSGFAQMEIEKVLKKARGEL